MTRRWFQFSLRSLLAVVTIGCILLVWRVEPKLRRREAVKAIAAKGGHFIYIVDEADATYTYEGQFVSYDFELKEPKWPPIGLILPDMTVSRDDLRTISRLESLQLLDVSDAKFPDEDVSELRTLQNLRDLMLPRKNLSQKTIAELKKVLPRCEIAER